MAGPWPQSLGEESEYSTLGQDTPRKKSERRASGRMSCKRSLNPTGNDSSTRPSCDVDIVNLVCPRRVAKEIEMSSKDAISTDQPLAERIAEEILERQRAGEHRQTGGSQYRTRKGVGPSCRSRVGRYSARSERN